VTTSVTALIRNRRRHSSGFWSTTVYGVIGLGVGLVLWTIAGTNQPVLLSTPWRSWQACVALISSGALSTAVAQSGGIFLAGLAAAIVVGVGYGILVTRVRILSDATTWLVFALQSVPIVAVAPIVLIVMGFGFSAKVFVVFASAVFPVLINTMGGARHVPAALLDAAHIFRSSEARIWRDVLIPHTIPYAMSGIRQGIAMALVGTLVAEFFLNASGIGGLMLSASSRFDTSTVLALTVFIAVVAVILMGAGALLERIFDSWRTEAEE